MQTVTRRLTAVYLGIMAVGIAVFLCIRWIGERWHPTAAAADALQSAHVPQPSSVDVIFHVLLTLTAVIVVGKLVSWGLQFLQQPPVMGEVLAGILLGPSVLGLVSPGVMHALVPGTEADPHRLVISSLKSISQLGIVLYMFLVGVELNTRKIRHHLHSAVAISHASIIVPFVLGAALALWLYPEKSSSDVTFTTFALFMGVAMAITAFPVLARILTDRGLDKSDLGVVALTCAATDDVTAWCLLALVVGVARSDVGSALLVTVGALAFICTMYLVVRPLILKGMQRWGGGSTSEGMVAFLFVGVLLAALITECIGIHAVFGAFVLGAIIPHDSRVARDLSEKLHDVATLLLLPAFFALTGMNTRIDLISGTQGWLTCAAIILVATLGKFGGTLLAARITGLNWRDGTALGVLMNTRGLMELIVLNIGLSIGVISPELFAMMVLMALATTLATSPVFALLTRHIPIEPVPVPLPGLAGAAAGGPGEHGSAAVRRMT